VLIALLVTSGMLAVAVTGAPFERTCIGYATTQLAK
jgi:hypothetical protein